MPGTFAGLLRYVHSLISFPAGRNNKSCRKRWLHSLDPTLRKGGREPISRFILFRSFILHVGRWTSEEDAALLKSVAKYGKRWYEVARALPGRTDDQCAKRYKDAVDPSIRWCNSPLPSCILTHLAGRDPWTAEEDELIWSAFEKHGNKWHTIANTLQGRPGQSN